MKPLSFLSILLLFQSSAPADDDPYKNFNSNFSVYSNNYYSPGDTVKLKVNTGYLERSPMFHAYVYRITDIDSFIINQKSRANLDIIAGDSSNLIQYCRLINSFSRILLAKESKYKVGDDEYKRYSVNDNMTYVPQEKGVYLIRVSHKKRVAYTGFIVTDLWMITQPAYNAVLCYVADKNSGVPIDNVHLKFYYGKDYFGEGSTSGGIFNLSISNDERDNLIKRKLNSPLIVGSKDSDVVVSNPGILFNFSEILYTVYIYTDQPVYRPASKASFKGIIRKNANEDYENVPNAEVIVTIKDSKKGVVYRRVVKSNDEGSFSGEYVIEENSSVGGYTITAMLDEAHSYSGSFSVEEFKKPEFKVVMKTDKDQYTDGEVISADISADYYFGSPVQEAEVNYSIFKKPFSRPWWYYSEYRWWYESYHGKQQTNYSGAQYIYNGQGKLGKDGKFSFLYSIEEDFKEKYKDWYGEEMTYETDYIYIVQVNVKDKSRRIVSDVKTVYVTRSQYDVASHTNKYVFKPGEKIGLEVRTMDFTDKPVEAKFNASVTSITWEKKKKKWKKNLRFVTTVSGKTYRDGTGIAFFDAAQVGYYQIEVTSFDNSGKKIATSANCYVSSGDMSWWYNPTGTLQIIPDKDSYNPGDTCLALVVVPSPDANILVTAKNYNILDYSTDNIREHSGYVSFVVGEDFYPNFYLDISYIRSGVLYSSNQSVLVLPEKKFLNVEITPDKLTYKPQDSGTVNVKVTDKSGNPVSNADVSIGMIDESIYAIKQESVTDIRNFFYSSKPNKVNTIANQNYQSYTNSRYPSLLEKINYKLYESYEFAEVRGRLVDEDKNPQNGLGILIDNGYLAAVTGTDGMFSFKIPEGNYTFSVLFYDFDVDGEFRFNVSRDKVNYLDIKTDRISLISAKDFHGGDLMKDRTEELISHVSADKENTNQAANTIMGRVTDFKGKYPLKGAIVKVEKTPYGSETDSTGSYVIKNVPAGSYSVKCSYLGYETMVVTNVIVTSTTGFTVDFALSERVVVADMIEVIGKRNVLSPDQSGRIITEEVIVNTGIKGIENISSKTAGIVTDELGYSINIRGGRTNETAIITEPFVEATTRTDFRDAMYWTPSVKTDENGIAKVDIKFPDNLTTWRITARVITLDTKVGQNTNSVVSRKDLIIRLETPRFFQEDDEVTISGIVHNYLNEDKQTKVSLKTENLQLMSPLPFGEGLGEGLLTMEKNEEKRIDWKIKVTEPIGFAKLTASALTNEESDAMELKVSIQPHGLKINQPLAFDFSKINRTRTEIVEIPEGTDLRTAKLRIGVSPSIASSLIASLDGLIGYPYGCIEQTMSRFVPTIIVQNIIKEMNAPADEYLVNQIPKIVRKSLNLIYSQQKLNGGWGWWGNDKSEPFMSSYVMYGLALARSSGLDKLNTQLTSLEAVNIENDTVSLTINEDVLQKGIKHLRFTLTQQKLEPAARAFVLFVLSQFDDIDPNKFDEQFKKIEDEELNDLSLALLSMAAGKLGRTETQKELIDILIAHRKPAGDDGYYWGGKKWDYRWYNDDIQVTSFVLKALLADENIYKENKEIANKAVDWLMLQRKGNSWGSTQQSAFIAYALSDYIRVSKELEPDYDMKIYVNNLPIIDKHFSSMDIFKREESGEVDGKHLKVGENEIRIEKSGPGRVYFTSNLIYYTNEKKLMPVDNGFEIRKEYFELRKKYDYEKERFVYQKKKFDGKVKSGDEILVKVKVSAKDPNLQYFMLEDPIPAGCEVIKDDWAYTIDEEKDYSGWDYYWWRWWYADKDIRDNRVTFFATYLWGDTYEFSYILRAQIPGKYSVIPATGMLMYYPEVRGSSKELRLEIEE
jgi:uncharacterized protein YfaS (alpha-2-macroglobulin family)